MINSRSKKVFNHNDHKEGTKGTTQECRNVSWKLYNFVNLLLCHFVTLYSGFEIFDIKLQWGIVFEIKKSGFSHIVVLLPVTLQCSEECIF